MLSEGVIDNALMQLFTIRMETGEFDPPEQGRLHQDHQGAIQSPAHQALAEKVAADDLVLLQNDNVTGTSSPLLPADPAKLNNIVIVGNLANTVTLGGYSGKPSLQVNAVQGITAAVKAANPARDGHLRRVRHLDDRHQPGVVLGRHPGRDQGRRPGHRVRRHRRERGRRGQRPDHARRCPATTTR